MNAVAEPKYKTPEYAKNSKKKEDQYNYKRKTKKLNLYFRFAEYSYPPYKT